MIHLELGKNSYDIELQKGSLSRVGEILNLNRKVMIVTDEGVPSVYTKQVVSACKEVVVEIIPCGEGSKSLQTAERILTRMLKYQFGRSDCVVSVGGGVVGDLGGFVASLYMRGIDFYNIPTTVLAQVDSSIGGKTAVNLAGFKNMIGAFHQPKRVLIDPDSLKSLSKRQILNGIVEAVKMGATSDKELFELFFKEDWMSYLDVIIKKALLVKKAVVEQDEKESHLRKILNYGHTVGHGFESAANGDYLHGECVALGMLYFGSNKVKEQLLEVYQNIGIQLPNVNAFNMTKVKEAILHDKKASGNNCSIVFVDEIGNGKIEEWSMDAVLQRLG